MTKARLRKRGADEGSADSAPSSRQRTNSDTKRRSPRLQAAIVCDWSTSSLIDSHTSRENGANTQNHKRTHKSDNKHTMCGYCTQPWEKPTQHNRPSQNQQVLHTEKHTITQAATFNQMESTTALCGHHPLINSDAHLLTFQNLTISRVPLLRPVFNCIGRPHQLQAMPFRSNVQWEIVHASIPPARINAVLDSMKAFRIVTSHETPCTVCYNTLDRHKMRYQLVACTSKPCGLLLPDAYCVWRGKIEQCQKTKHFSVSQHGHHLVHEHPPPQNRLSREMKQFVREMTEQGMKPVRIRIQMVNTFRLSSIELPTLRQVQSVSTYYTKKHMANEDKRQTVCALVNELIYRPTSNECEPFVFGFKHDAIGRPHVGRGSDEDLFLLGVTSKRLLRQIDAPTDTFVFHVDATFKLSTLGFPVLVCGVSDQNRRFHLVALFIMSQRTKAVYQEALQALRTTFSVVVGKAIAIRYVMGDAEHAQYAAVEAFFGNTEYLMCFYHLIANGQEHLRGVSNEACIELLREIYAMHYSSSVDEFYAIVQESFHSWSRRPDLLGFAQYFNNQRRLGRFRVWQCFARPAGYATTNNPVEQFNNVLKRDYSLRARLKLGTLVKLIASCVRASSVDTTPLATTSTIPLAIRTRMKILVRANKLVMKPPRLSMSFLLIDTSTQNPSNTEPGVVFVFSCRGSAGIKTGNSTSISYLNAEM